MQPDQSSNRIEFANALRGVACVTVMLCHILGTFWTGQGVIKWLTGMPELAVPVPGFSALVLQPPFGIGGFAVGLFLVISGFVIPYSLLTYSVRGFLAGRVFRIYPTYLASLSYVVLFVLAAAAIDSVTPFGLKDVLAHAVPPFHLILTTKPIDGVVWTLEIEVIFYALCALLAKPIREGRWSVLIGPLGALAFWLAMFSLAGSLAPNGDWKVFHLQQWGAHVAFLGLTFCGVALNFRQRGLFSRWQAGLMIAVSLTVFLSSRWIGDNPIIEPWGYSLALVFFILCMWAQRWYRQGRLLRYFADISYPLYIVHSVPGYVIMHVLWLNGASPLVCVGAALSAALVSATLIHRFVEQPSHRKGQRFARALSQRSAPKEVFAGVPANAQPAASPQGA